MFVQVITCVRRKGVGAESRKAYDFQAVGALITTAQGTEFCEFMLDADAPQPVIGKKYELEMSFYPNLQKKLTFRVEGLRELPQAAKAA